MAKRKALGRGLSALIPEANGMGEREASFFHCPVESIKPNPLQPRQDFSSTELDEMAQSVREKGIITPLLVTRTASGYQLIAGERRWRAAQKAGIHRVPVVVREVTPLESLELAIIENIHRKDLNPIEEALAYQRLMEETGTTQEILARKIGRDRSSIANLLRLLRLPELIQKDIIDGRLSMGHARVLVGLKTKEEQQKLRKMILERELSVRQAEAYSRRQKSTPKSRPASSEINAYLRSLEVQLKRSMGTKVEIKKRGRQGQIVIHFYSDEELDRLLEMMS